MEKTLTFLQIIKFVVSFSLNVSVHRFFGASFHDHRLSLIARRQDPMRDNYCSFPRKIKDAGFTRSVLVLFLPSFSNA